MRRQELSGWPDGPIYHKQPDVLAQQDGRQAALLTKHEDLPYHLMLMIICFDTVMEHEART